MLDQTDSYDSPWKDMLDLYLRDFFGLFLPEIHDAVDWSRPPVSLEQELRKIVRDSELGTRFADKLFQVWTRDGESLEVMVNVEVQGSPAPDFAKRIFTYNYRTYDRFDRPVVSVAVLCDESKSFRPQEFVAFDLWGCRSRLDFPTIKLRDYNDRWEELEASDNPFATVAMAHLKTQATRKAPEDRYRWKLSLTRRLYDQGYGKDDIIQLFRFIDWVMSLPRELEKRLDHEIEAIETERGMQYVTGIERRALERGVKQGIEQGIQRGEVGLFRSLLSQVFGEIPASIEKRVETASSDQIKAWIPRVLSAETLEDVFGQE